VCNIVVKKFTFAISSPDEFLLRFWYRALDCWLFVSFSAHVNISSRMVSYHMACTTSHGVNRMYDCDQVHVSSRRSQSAMTMYSV